MIGDNQRQRDIFTVSRLNMEVRSALEGSFPLLWISGEISNLSMPRSGHLYFSLKDSQAQVRAALFRNKRNYLRFSPQDGMQVIVRARVTLYEPRGDYQLIIEQMEIAGEGILRQQVEALKQKLDQEGLFATAGKREIPRFPRSIGVMTSASGAALHDVLTVLRRRSPMTRVIVYPVTVQGKKAALDMTEMVKLVDKRAECDLLLVTRGGGSFEDLMPFNHEALVRAIYQIKIPVISAVGHEVDTTLCDYVADQRAPTPSAAAEMASADQWQLLETIRFQQNKLRVQMLRLVQRHAQSVDYSVKRLESHHPLKHLQRTRQRLAVLRHQLEIHQGNQLKKLSMQLSHLTQRSRLQSPRQHLMSARQLCLQQQQRLFRSIYQLMSNSRQQLLTRTALLNSLSPLATLERGYAIAFDENKRAVRDACNLEVGDKLRVHFATGEVDCLVENIVPGQNK